MKKINMLLIFLGVAGAVCGFCGCGTTKVDNTDACHIVCDKGGVIAVNGVWCVEKNRKQVFLDVAYLCGVLVHTVNHKLDMAAVELHKF